MQKQRERRTGPFLQPVNPPAPQVAKASDKGDGEGEKEELVLQDTFAQETAVTVEDPNMYRLAALVLLEVYQFATDVVCQPRQGTERWGF